MRCLARVQDLSKSMKSFFKFFMVVTCLFSHESVVFGRCNWQGSDVGADIGDVAGSYTPPSSQRNRSSHLVLPHCPDPQRNSLFDSSA
jgi:hypothetical protein